MGADDGLSRQEFRDYGSHFSREHLRNSIECISDLISSDDLAIAPYMDTLSVYFRKKGCNYSFIISLHSELLKKIKITRTIEGRTILNRSFVFEKDIGKFLEKKTENFDGIHQVFSIEELKTMLPNDLEKVSIEVAQHTTLKLQRFSPKKYTQSVQSTSTELVKLSEIFEHLPTTINKKIIHDYFIILIATQRLTRFLRACEFFHSNKSVLMNLYAVNFMKDLYGNVDFLKLYNAFQTKNFSYTQLAFTHYIYNIKQPINEKKSGIDFELECEQALSGAGWSVTRTPIAGDFGGDLIATRKSISICVQCKHLNRPAGIDAV